MLNYGSAGLNSLIQWLVCMEVGTNDFWEEDWTMLVWSKPVPRFVYNFFSIAILLASVPTKSVLSRLQFCVPANHYYPSLTHCPIPPQCASIEAHALSRLASLFLLIQNTLSTSIPNTKQYRSKSN